MIDYEEGICKAIADYKEGERSRWRAAFDIWDLWLAFPNRHGEMMAVLTTELNVTDDMIYNFLRAAGRAGLSDTNRKLTSKLSISHFYRLDMIAEKYNLPNTTVVDYLEIAATHNISAQKMIEHIMEAHDPDPEFMWHRSVRGAKRACRKLLELAEFNGLEQRAREAARLLLDILEDLNNDS
jgi:hypothetical protein